MNRSKSAAQRARDAQKIQRAQSKKEKADAMKLEKRRKAIYTGKVIEEKGIEEDLLLRIGWKETFEGRGWMKLVEEPIPANLDVVREFYFNLNPESSASAQLVEVRDCIVKFSPEMINDYLGTPDIEHCKYGFTPVVLYMTDEDILRNICGPDHSKTSDHTTLSDLCYESHIWNLFASYSLTPVGRRSGFTSIRLQMLYAIQNGHAIDLGQLIYRQIVEHGQGAENRSLVFPSLITGMCKAAGIEVDATGEALTTPTMIDFKSINYIRNWRDMPRLQTSRELARAERREAASSSSQRSSGTSSRPRSSSRRSTSDTSELADLLRQNNAVQQEMKEAQQEMIAAQQQMIETMMRNRAEDQDTINQLRDTIARLEAKVQEIQARAMYGQTYQRRHVSRG